jgi:hypothetical protein
MSSMTVEISRGTSWRMEKLGFGDKKVKVMFY